MLAMLPLCKPLGLPRHICRTTSYRLFIYYTLKWFKMCRICTVYIYLHIYIYIYFNWFVYYILYCLLMFINRFIHSLSCIYHTYIYICNSMWRHSARRLEDHHLLLFNGPRSETHTISGQSLRETLSVEDGLFGLGLQSQHPVRDFTARLPHDSHNASRCVRGSSKKNTVDLWVLEITRNLE